MSLVDCLSETEEKPSTAQEKVTRCIDPLNDQRWDVFLQKHPRASLFHSSAWLHTLSRTYGFRPIAYTTSADDQDLENAFVFCSVESWLTGRRLVSLPFSDHCEPLVDREDDLEALSVALDREFHRERWRYIELRPLRDFGIKSPLWHPFATYSFHELDLSPDIGTLFRNCHKNSTQRKILRAGRERLKYREEPTTELLDHFYRLHTITRMRHSRPPQPRKWFVNLIDCFGKNLKIRVAFKGDLPVAAVLTICYKNTLVYKYGASDSRINNLGGIHLLLWRAIQEAKASGLHSVDFGRTDEGQDGLVTFKNRWGTGQSNLTYLRYGSSPKNAYILDSLAGKRGSGMAKHFLARIPGLMLLGRALYRHAG